VLDSPTATAAASAPSITPPTGFVLDKPTSTIKPPSGFTLDSPQSGQPNVGAPTQQTDPEAGKAWYEKAWDWANAPTVNFNSSNQGGFTGGAEDVASGLTSPLSIGLTVGTLGGGALLKTLGIAAEELPLAVRGLKALTDAGFTGQAAYQAIRESPSVLDALKDGDYSTAERLATHVLAGATFAELGRHQLAGDSGTLGEVTGKVLGKDAGDYVKNFATKIGAKVAPTFENMLLRTKYGKYQGDVATYHKIASDLGEAWHKQFKTLSPQDREATMYHMEAGGDDSPETKAKLTDRYNYIADSAGRPEDKIPVDETPQRILAQRGLDYKGELTPGSGVHMFEDPRFPGKTVALKQEDFTPDNVKTAIQQKLRDFKIPETQVETSGVLDKDIQHYNDITAEQHIKDEYTPKEIDNLMGAYKKAILATPTDNPAVYGLSKQARDVFNEWGEKAKDNSVITKTVQDYITHLWGKDADNPAANLLAHDASGFHTNATMARNRIFDNAFEGQIYGKKLAVTDPVPIAANYISKIGEAIAGRDFKKSLFGVRAADGRPLLAHSGAGELLEDSVDKDGKVLPPSVMVNPRTLRNIRVADATVQGLKTAGTFDSLLDEGKLVKLPLKEGKPQSYAWSTRDYRQSTSPDLRDWTHVATDSGGKPVFVKSDIMVHPDAHDYLEKLIGEQKSSIKNIPIVSSLLKAGGELKHLQLALSPFHIAQEGLRAIMTGVSPWGVEKYSLDDGSPQAKNLLNGIRESLTVGKDRASVQDYQEGNVASGQSKIISKIPLVRDVQASLQSFLFDKYIPGLKVRAFHHLFEDYNNSLSNPETLDKLIKQRPDMKGYTQDRAAARLAAEDANERFGGLNYKQLGRSAGLQDFFRLGALAPDWLESEARQAVRAIKGGPQGNIARMDMVKLTAGLWASSRVLNLLTSGQPHLEAPFGVALKDKDGKEKIYSVRTLPTDIFHMVSAPADFLRGRVSPLTKIASTVYSGRDYAGRRQTPFQTAVDIGEGSLPIPVQQIAQVGGEQGFNTTDQIYKSAGGTASVYKTQAQQTAAQLASDRSETGPVDPAQLAKHQAKLNLEDDIRAGLATDTTVHDLVESGDLSPTEGADIKKNEALTKGMDPEMAKLYIRADKLPMKDFFTVWDQATGDEKIALAKLMHKKAQSYVKKAAKDFSPKEKLNDPVYRRIKRAIPEIQTW
jgi:hypothetical protein